MSCHIPVRFCEAARTTSQHIFGTLHFACFPVVWRSAVRPAGLDFGPTFVNSIEWRRWNMVQVASVRAKGVAVGLPSPGEGCYFWKFFFFF